MMTTFVKGKNVQEVENLKNDFVNFMTKDKSDTKSKVGRLSIFEGVKEFPVRVKCATLIWRTLEDALKGIKEREER